MSKITKQAHVPLVVPAPAGAWFVIPLLSAAVMLGLAMTQASTASDIEPWSIDMIANTVFTP